MPNNHPFLPQKSPQYYQTESHIRFTNIGWERRLAVCRTASKRKDLLLLTTRRMWHGLYLKEKPQKHVSDDMWLQKWMSKGTTICLDTYLFRACSVLFLKPTPQVKIFPWNGFHQVLKFKCLIPHICIYFCWFLINHKKIILLVLHAIFRKREVKFLFYDLPVHVKIKDTILDIRIFQMFPRCLLHLGKLNFLFCLHLLIFTHLCHFPACSLMTWSDFIFMWSSNLHFRSPASSYLIKIHLMGLSNFYYKTFLESSPGA